MQVKQPISKLFNSSGTWTKPSGYGANSRVYIQVWGGGGAGGTGPSALGGGGGGGGVAPTAPRIPQSISGTKLGGNSEVTTTGKSTTGKVIVVETDITNTQNKVKGIIRKATIK